MGAQTQIFDAGNQAGVVIPLADQLQLIATARDGKRVGKPVERPDIIRKPGKHRGVKRLRNRRRHCMKTGTATSRNALCLRKRERQKRHRAKRIAMRKARLKKGAIIQHAGGLSD